jgi:hypothetical protein
MVCGTHQSDLWSLDLDTVSQFGLEVHHYSDNDFIGCQQRSGRVGLTEPRDLPGGQSADDYVYPQPLHAANVVCGTDGARSGTVSGPLVRCTVGTSCQNTDLVWTNDECGKGSSEPPPTACEDDANVRSDNGERAMRKLPRDLDTTSEAMWPCVALLVAVMDLRRTKPEGVGHHQELREVKTMGSKRLLVNLGSKGTDHLMRNTRNNLCRAHLEGVGHHCEILHCLAIYVVGLRPLMSGLCFKDNAPLTMSTLEKCIRLVLRLQAPNAGRSDPEGVVCRLTYKPNKRASDERARGMTVQLQYAAVPVLDLNRASTSERAVDWCVAHGMSQQPACSGRRRRAATFRPRVYGVRRGVGVYEV